MGELQAGTTGFRHRVSRWRSAFRKREVGVGGGLMGDKSWTTPEHAGQPVAEPRPEIETRRALRRLGLRYRVGVAPNQRSGDGRALCSPVHESPPSSMAYPGTVVLSMAGVPGTTVARATASMRRFPTVGIKNVAGMCRNPSTRGSTVPLGGPRHVDPAGDVLAGCHSEHQLPFRFVETGCARQPGHVDLRTPNRQRPVGGTAELWPRDSGTRPAPQHPSH